MSIVHNSRFYVIEKCEGRNFVGAPFALDRKEPERNGLTCLVNVGWYDSDMKALTAMKQDFLARTPK